MAILSTELTPLFCFHPCLLQRETVKRRRLKEKCLLLAALLLKKLSLFCAVSPDGREGDVLSARKRSLRCLILRKHLESTSVGAPDEITTVVFSLATGQFCLISVVSTSFSKDFDVLLRVSSWNVW